MDIVFSDEELDPNLTCCTCYGCPDCEHTCNRTEEERAAEMEAWRNAVPLSREESEALRERMKDATIEIPRGLAHIDYGE